MNKAFTVDSWFRPSLRNDLSHPDDAFINYLLIHQNSLNYGGKFLMKLPFNIVIFPFSPFGQEMPQMTGDESMLGEGGCKIEVVLLLHP